MPRVFGSTEGEVVELMEQVSEQGMSDSELRKLLDKLEECYIRADAKGHVVLANAASAKIFGYTAHEDMLGLDMRELWFNPNDRQAMIESLEEQGLSLNYRMHARRKDGEAFLALCSFRLIVDEKDQNAGIETILREITDITQAQEKLKDREAYLNQILQTTSDGFHVLDHQGHIVEVNDAFCRMTGFERGELLGMNIHELDANATRAEFSMHTERVIRNGSDVLETRHRRKDGSIIPIEISVTYMSEQGGQLICFSRDLTSRKLAKNALKREHKMLARTEALTNVGSWEWDAETDKVTWSDELYRIFGLEPGQEAPNFAKHQAFYVPEDRARLLQAVEECLQNGVPYHMEVRITRTDGELRHCIVRGFSEQSADGTIKHLAGSLQDITESKQIEKQLSETQHVLQAAMDNSQAGIAIADAPDGKLRYVNKAGLMIRGASAEEIVKDVGAGQYVSTWRLLDLDGKTPLKTEEVPLARALMYGEICTREFIVRRAEEDDRIVWANAAPIQNAEGDVVSAIVIFLDVTEQKQAEEALRKSEERLHVAIEGAQIGLWDWDVATNTVRYSDTWAEMFGEKPEVVKQTVEAFISRVHADDRTLVEKRLEKHLNGEVDAYESEHRMRTAAGDYIWTLDRGRVMERDAEGKPVRVAGLIANIDELKQTEQALHDSEQRWKNILVHTPQLGLSLDPQARITFANRHLLKTTGYSEEEVLGGDWFDLFIPEEVREKVRAVFLESMEAQGTEGFTSFFENEILTKHGERRLIAWSNVATLGTDNKIAEVTCLGTDLTERVRADAALQAAERRNQALVDYSPVCHKIVDLDFNLQYMSKSGFTMLQLDDDDAEVYGKPYPFRFFPSDFRQGMTDSLEQVKKSGKTITFKGLTKDSKGNDVWLNSVLVPVLQDDGKLDYVTVVSADETQAKRLESELLQAQKMESIGRLAGGVAHDFNNMLNVIQGHTELAADDLAQDNPLNDHLDEIRNAAKRSANLTRQLLAFARKETIAPKVLNLNESIAAMLKMLQRLVGEDIDLLWRPDSRLNQIIFDPGQVDQILANLVVNARDAIRGTNGRITIETAGASFNEEYCANHVDFVPGDYVMLAVSDNGSGIDEETRAKIFEPFFTTKSVGEGTGLGLPTIYGIVKQNDGFIHVYSEPGSGTTFRIYLPAYEDLPEDSNGTSDESGELARGEETILVVEDEPAILNMVRTMLERQGYTVLTAVTPGEALDIAREKADTIDLLITDVIMPEMNGRDLARSLQEYCPNVQILFMSGYTESVFSHQGVLDKGLSFIQKPFSRKDLAINVREALDS